MQFYHDQARNLLIYERPSDLVLQHIPEARPLNSGYVAVPATLQNSQVLRWLNHPVAPVITDANYDWPIEPGRKPLVHQKVTANFAVLHPKCYVLSDMGTMKTLSILWAADWAMKQHPEGTFRALIVAPLSILERVWARALFSNLLGRRSFEILYGDADKRCRLLEKPCDFYIVNPDGVGIGAHTRKRFELDGFSKQLADRKDIKLCIIDEASAYKDASTKRHKIAREIITPKPFIWEMTGTPTPNSPVDAYGLARLLGQTYGESEKNFREKTMIKVSNFVWRPRPGGYDLARRLLTPSIRFDIRDIWDGPELTTQQRKIELTVEQKKHFADLKRDMQVVMKSGQPITAAGEAAARTKLIQISLGGIYDGDHVSHSIDAKPRIDELKAVLEQAPSKSLIFVPLTNIVNMLHKELRKHWTCEIVNGNTSQKDRSRIFQAFQEKPDPRILLADPGTASHGLDLFAAQTVIWYGPTDKTELYLQANKRAHRPGQRYPVTIVQFVSNKLEQEIFQHLETNTSLQGTLLDLIARGEL